MFDFDTFNTLCGMDDGSMTGTFDAHNNLLETSRHLGSDMVQHFDHSGALTGTDMHVGNSVMHHDAHGMLTGHDTMFGGSMYHHDASGFITGHDTQVGSSVFHYDAHGQNTGHTDANGNEYNSIGQITNRFRKIF